MSWDGYIDTILGYCKGACDKVAIIGLPGGAKWTSDSHANSFKVTPAEAQKIATALSNEDDSDFAANGVFVDTIKYQFLRADFQDGSVQGKKKDHGAITIHKAQTLVVIAHTAEGKGSGDVTEGVAKIIDYFKSLNM